MSDAGKAERQAKIDKIRALMAKTTAAGCTEAEASAAAAAVDRLLAQYEIDLDEVTVREQPVVQVSVPRAGSHAVEYSARKIAAFTDTHVWKDGSHIVYFGFQVDTQIAEYLTLLFLRAMDREGADFTMFNHDYDQLKSSGAKAEMVYSFKRGMAARLGERLDALKSKRDFEQRTTGRDLVVIKANVVDAAYAALGLTMGGSHRGRAVSDPAAFAKGREAANNVSINQGIAGRAQSRGRVK